MSIRPQRLGNTPKRIWPRYSNAAVGVIAALGIAVGLSGCGGSDDGADSVVVVEEIRFKDWDAYLSSDEHARVHPKPVVVVGVDGVPWHFVDQLIMDGQLPNLARMKREGSYASLVSTRSYVTPPAWTTMFTGYLPEKTGIYSFGKWKRETKEFLAVNADDVKVPFVWDAASKAGLKVGVFNVPMTFPVHPVNGALVSGMMTPIEGQNAIQVRPMADQRLKQYYKVYPGIKDYSRPMYTAIGDSLNIFMLVLHDTTDDRVNNYDRVSIRVISRAPMDAESPALGVFTTEVNSYSHWLPTRYWKDGGIVPSWTRIHIEVDNRGGFNAETSQTLFPIDETYTFPEGLHDVLTDRFGFYLPTKFLSKEIVPSLTEDMAEYAKFFYRRDDWDLYHFVFTQTDNIHHVAGFTILAAEVYRTIDRAIGELMDEMPPGGTLIVASDHGNGEYEYGIDLNQFLAALKLLEWETPRKIDHENTLVFHNLWHLYFNRDKITREELAGRGIGVPDGTDPYDYLVLYIIEAGRQLSSPDGSRGFPLEFHRLAERSDENDPDMWVVGSYGDYICDYWNIMQPHQKLIRVNEGSDRYWHIRDGIFLAWGDDVRRGYDAGSKQIQDVGPTILYIAGLPVAPDMNGAPMKDIFKPGLLENRPLFVNEAYLDIPKEAVMDPDDRGSLEKKLKSLGYIH